MFRRPIPAPQCADTHRSHTRLASYQATPQSIGAPDAHGAAPVAVQRAQLAALQQIAGNQAAQRLLAGPGLIQRGIRKPGKKGGFYTNPPTSHEGERLSKSVKEELKKIIQKDELHKTGRHYTLKQAITVAKRRAAASGRFRTGRKGKRINNTGDMTTYLKTRGVNTTAVEDKFTNHGLGFDAIFQKVEIVEDDFKGMPVSTSATKAYSNFTSTLNQVAPQMTRTISAFNEMVDEMQAADQHVGSASKGRMFEVWSLDNVLKLSQNRETWAKQGTMSSNRLCDGFNTATNTLWDMKHYYTKVAASTDNYQAADYDEIVKNGYASNNGHTVSTVNYLFPTLDAAKKNDWLASTYGFGVYYVDSPDKLVKYA